MSFPRATVRLQLHRGFDFDAAAACVDYYSQLGISHYYLSPIWAARPGSLHGYDVIDPTRINPELGGEEGLQRLVQALRGAGMGLVVDLVPNHLGIAAGANRYWDSVLAWGRRSPWAHWFDIDWEVDDPRLRGKLLWPVLGEPCDEALAAGHLTLRFDGGDLGLVLSYRDSLRLPLNAASQATLLARAPVFAGVAQALTAATPETAPPVYDELARLADGRQGRGAMERLLADGNARDLEGRQRLQALLARQHYRLSWWRNAAEEINWRRFFEVAELAGVRVELDEVFEATHVLLFNLYERGLIDGVRIDHIDGLAEPGAYARKLRQRLATLQAGRPAPLDAGPAWIVVEKILLPGEALPAAWETDGSTGYDFMDQVGALLHDGEGELALRALWAELTGDTRMLDDHVGAARLQLLEANFGGEFEGLVRALHACVMEAPLGGRDLSPNALRRVLRAVLVAFRRYRSYGPEDAGVAASALQAARAALAAPDHALLDEVACRLQLLPGDAGDENAAPGETQELALRHFRQLTPPLAAKSVEDTAFYRYGPLLSRNEVGSYPQEPAPGAAAFHEAMLRRVRDTPRAMLATATHDHKRGEDARARLAVLSEQPALWADTLRRWVAAHTPLCARLSRPGLDALEAPAPADRIMLYQTLVAAWPPGLESSDSEAVAAFAERVAAWQQKALREAKLHSSWMLPQPDYEDACRGYLMALLQGEASRDFLVQLSELLAVITPAARNNSLTQTLLRLTCPGVPDLYQGCELADFSLVDPDNRRPVDMAVRQAGLALPWPPTSGWQADTLLYGKQALIRRVLDVRRRYPAVFCGGDYLPLEVTGPAAGHVLAFARRAAEGMTITAVLRHAARLTNAANDAGWANTYIELPSAVQAARWPDVLSDQVHAADRRGLSAARVFLQSPVALLLPRSEANPGH
ncbi:malto-oligosyltrehalose synthase [Polaromonas aquatica]|uniref:malto-oligosyltrehalose synthase n=1 Tax=Polaromonas aquatica TaxID=332657 RepID=UPI003D650E26